MIRVKNSKIYLRRSELPRKVIIVPHHSASEETIKACVKDFIEYRMRS